jgi:hypothetical protein
MAKPKPAAAPAPEPTPAPAAAENEGGGGAFMVDFSTVGDEKPFQVIPRGVYDAEVDEVTYGQSQTSGNNMWTLKLALADTAGEFAGRKVFFHMPFVESMQPRNKKIIGRIAPELLEGAFDPQKVADEGILVGKPCQVRLDVRPYQGEQRNNVRDVLAPKAAGGEGFLPQQ